MIIPIVLYWCSLFLIQTNQVKQPQTSRYKFTQINKKSEGKVPNLINKYISFFYWQVALLALREDDKQEWLADQFYFHRP